MSEFTDMAVEVGFTQEQADFMEQWLAQESHSHGVDEIDGLDEAIDEKVDEALEGGEDEE